MEITYKKDDIIALIKKDINRKGFVTASDVLYYQFDNTYVVKVKTIDDRLDELCDKHRKFKL